MFEQYITNDYLRTVLILFFYLLIIRLAAFIFERGSLFFASRTKTQADDIFIKKASLPITIASLFFAVLISLRELHLEQNTSLIVNNILHSLIAVILAYIFFLLVKLIFLRAILKITRKTKTSLDNSLTSIFDGFFKFFFIVSTILYILNLWGIEVGPLLAGLGIAGLAVALALQPVLSNIFSGAAMVLDKSIRVGDLVYLDDKTKGKIEKIGIRSTKIRTFDNEYLIVPNNKLADSTIQNVALPEPKSRVVIPFSVVYGSDINKVKKIVYKEIIKIKNVAADPEPLVRFVEMGNSSLNFKVYFHVESFEDRFYAIDEANTRIYNILNKNKIEIPFPQLDVHIKK